MLDVTGDQSSNAIVYAHCAAYDRFGFNGSVTVFAANPSTAPVELAVNFPAHPRLEYVLTAPNDDLTSHSPVLNGNLAHPLQLGADGSLPSLPGAFCFGTEDCTEPLVLPARSQAFFVLLHAQHTGCGGEPTNQPINDPSCTYPKATRSRAMDARCSGSSQLGGGPISGIVLGSITLSTLIGIAVVVGIRRRRPTSISLPSADHQIVQHKDTIGLVDAL